MGCEQLIWDFFDAGGQVVIYDANNGSSDARQAVAEKFDKAGAHVIFLGEHFNSVYTESLWIASSADGADR